MPKTNQSINADLEELLVSKGYDVTPLDSSGKPVPVADDSELMQFHFHRDGKDYGTVTVTIDGLQKLTVYYDDEIANSGGMNESDDNRGMNGTSWISLVKQLKKFAQQHQLGFVLKDTDRLRNDMKKRAHQKTLEESSQLKDDLEFMTESSFKKFYGVGKREFVAEGSGFDDWADSRAASQLYKLKPATEWTVSYDYGPHMTKSVTVKARSEQEARDKVENAAEKKGISIMINSVEPAPQGVDEGFIEEALQAPPTSTGNSLLDEFIGRYVKDGWKYHGTNKRGGHEFRKRRYMPAALYGLKDGGVIESHNNGTRVSRFDSSGKRVAKLADGPLSEQGVAEGSASGTKILYTGKDKGGTVTISYEPDYIPGHSEKYITRFDGRVKSEMPTLRSAVYGLTHYQFDTFRPNLQPNPKTALEQGAAKDNQMKLDEGYYGNRKMSYNDDTPTVKMVIKHNKQIEETDQRFRHIERIFLETSNGERFVVETTKPSRARMFARHIAEGGGYKDERWNHIKELCEDIDALGGFIRATRSSEQFNESAQRMIGEVADKYSELKTTAKRLQTGRGYNSYFESYKPSSKNEDSNDLLEVFKHSSVDSRIERALPTLNKLGIRKGILEEADIFEQWAESVIDESLDVGNDRQAEEIVELFADEIPVGPNAEVAIAELGDIIEDDDLYNRLRRVAAVNPNNDARPQIIAWMQEQDTPEYRNLLSKLEKEDGDSPQDKKEVEKSDSSKSVEPAKVAPKKKQPNPAGDMGGGLPPLPGGPGDMSGGLPPLPPLPPLKEGDSDLASFKRLIGK